VAKRRAPYFVACGFTLWAACGDGSEALDSDRYEISGSVVDARTQQALDQAEVRFVSDVLDRADAHSDKAGKFSFAIDVREGVSFGTVSASHAGYEVGVAQTVYFDESPHLLAFQLTRLPKK
jgi:hypothetical protein